MIDKAIKWGREVVGLIVICVMLASSLPSLAQLPTATILGVVRDVTGAVVPGATLMARNVETAQARTTTSAADGSYRFSALPVGHYEVRVEQPGFQSEVRTGLTLTVGQEAVINFTMQVGAVEQTIAVTAEAPLVNTTSGSLGGLVDEQKMADLPLNGRNFVDLAFLQTGVARDPASKSGGPIMRGDWFSSNGAQGRSNNFLLDGALMTNLNGNGPSTNADWSPGVEGIQEFRVVTNSYSAEYGMKMGAQVTIVSKAGTNTFRGSLFEYHRNDNLDARNFFDRKTALTPSRLPEFKRNNFGGSVGGPIRADHVFFNAVYEGLRERLGTTHLATVIPAADKANPQVSPVIKPFLEFYPDPNLGSNQFTSSPAQPTRGDYGQVRIDDSISSADSLFGRYTIQDSVLFLPTSIPQFGDNRTGRSQFATLSENHIFSPTLLNSFRFSYSRTNDTGTNISEPAGPQLSFVPSRGMGNLTVGGITSLGPSGVNPLIAKQNIFSWSDDLFFTRGRHSLKFGVLFNRFQQYSLTSTNVRGQIRFPNVAAFLAASPSDYTAVTGGAGDSSPTVDRSWEFTTAGFYVQDDLRMRPTLTLNLGLRYEFHTEFQETRGKGSSLRDLVRDTEFTVGPMFKNPSLRNFSPRFGFAWDVRGDGRTAVRGGFAVLYDVAVGIGGAIITTTVLPPFAYTSTLGGSPSLSIPLTFPSATIGKTTRPMQWDIENPHMLQYSLAVERQLPFDTGLTLAYSGTRGLNLMQRYDGNPTIPQIQPDGRKFWAGNELRVNPNWDMMELKDASGSSWYNSLQLTLQKRLSRGLQFQSSYTWSKVLDVTSSQISEAGGGGDVPPPDSLNRNADKAPARFDLPHNLKFNAIYYLPNLISSGGVAGGLLNGWWFGGILSLQGGTPFNPTLQGNRSLSKIGVGGFGTVNDRPDRVTGRSNDDIISGTTAACSGVAAGQKLGTPDRYFDPCAFTLQSAGYLGTSGRNVLRGPGLANLDFSLVKNTPLRFLGEAGKLEFRAEFFNIFNRANFVAPASLVFAGVPTTVDEPRLGTAGLITSTSTTSRQIQLALKILF